MRTGPTNTSTRQVIVALEKHGKKAKKSVWRYLSKKLGSSTRSRVTVNVYKLSEIAAKRKGKVLVVPGKVLAKGDIGNAVKVACFACSAKAKQKIEESGGKVMTLAELMQEKPKENTLAVVQ